MVRNDINKVRTKSVCYIIRVTDFMAVQFEGKRQSNPIGLGVHEFIQDSSGFLHIRLS